MGVAAQTSEAEAFGDEFLRSLADWGLQLIIADDHNGLKAVAAKVTDASVQRCHVHFTRNALVCVDRRHRPIVTGVLCTAFEQVTLIASKAHRVKLPLGDLPPGIRAIANWNFPPLNS